MPALLAVFSAGLLSLGSPGEQPAPMRTTRPDKLPRAREEPTKPGPEATPPAKRQRIFGIGVGFEKSGSLSGVPLNIVLPDSPAWRAGLLPGCIISAINGEPTVGHTGEECARLIREASATVKIKFLDPALREKSITLEKEWIVVPE